MPVELNEVKHIAKLAKLNFSEKEFDELTNDLNSILDYMSKLNEVNTENIEPLSHPSQLFNENRKDLTIVSVDKNEVFKNTPYNDGEFFLIPKIIG